ncbi:MAG: DUF3870 domain-containing protein [Dethiobacteria bacterium]|nr:DUF3870 domain-containing protein [Bacillota bacterium]
MEEVNRKLGQEEKTILVTGYAKLPHNIAATHSKQGIILALEIDPQTSKVVDAECTVRTNLAQKFIRELIVGADLINGFDKLLVDIEKHYLGGANKAIITALKVVHSKYLSYRRCRAAASSKAPGQQI